MTKDQFNIHQISKYVFVLLALLACAVAKEKAKIIILKSF